MKPNIITSCTAKKRYESKREADLTADYLATKFVQVRSYHCTLCSGWHLTANLKGKH